MTTLQQLHEIVLSRRVPANIFDILGEAAVALRALAEEVEIGKGMLGATMAEIAALRAAPVETRLSIAEVAVAELAEARAKITELEAENKRQRALALEEAAELAGYRYGDNAIANGIRRLKDNPDVERGR